jgi:hypothetical protein
MQKCTRVKSERPLNARTGGKQSCLRHQPRNPVQIAGWLSPKPPGFPPNWRGSEIAQDGPSQSRCYGIA